MREEIFELALKRLEKLLKKYSGFRNIIVDDWRGFRFVFDTEDVRKCDGQCAKCSLYQLLKDEEFENGFTAGLQVASQRDKELFGSQPMLNCKTLDQYSSCYANFILKEAKTKQEVLDEFRLVNNCKVIFSRDGDAEKVEFDFKNDVFKKILRLEFWKNLSIFC